MSVVNEVSDIAADLISGTFGPIGAAAASLAEQTFTDNTVEEMKANNERYNEALNYSPRTDMGKAVNKGAMEAIGEGTAAVVNYYNENEEKIPDSVKGAVSTVADTWNDLDESTRFALGNLATVGEVVPIGKAASMLRRGSKLAPEDIMPDGVPVKDPMQPTPELQQNSALRLPAKRAAMTPNVDELGYTSGIEEGIIAMINDPKVPDNVSSKQLLDLLKKRGVKDDEIEWSTFSDYVGTLGKQQIPLDEALRQAKARAISLDVVELKAIDEVVHPDYSPVGGTNYKELLFKFDTAEGLMKERKSLRVDKNALSKQLKSLNADRIKREKQILDSTGATSRDTQILTDRYAVRSAVRDEMPQSKKELKLDLELEEVLDKIMEVRNKIENATFTDGHWMTVGQKYPTPNVIFHARVTDREIAGGKSLAIDEIQSDWHQGKGKVKDRPYYKLPEDKLKPHIQNQIKQQQIAYNKSEKNYDKSRKDSIELHKSTQGSYSAQFGKKDYKGLYGIKAYKAIADDRNKIKEDTERFKKELNDSSAELANHKEQLYTLDTWGYDSFTKDLRPNAPLKNKDKWMEASLNAMIFKAVKEGYDSISFPNGKTNSALYDGLEGSSKEALEKMYDTTVPNMLRKMASKLDPDAVLVRGKHSSESSPLPTRMQSIEDDIYGEQQWDEFVGDGEIVDGDLYDRYGDLVERDINRRDFNREHGFLTDQPIELQYEDYMHQGGANRMSFEEYKKANTKDEVNSSYSHIKITPRMREAVLKGKPLFLAEGGYVSGAVDIATDLISGTFGPIGAAGASLAEQAFTDNTVEEMKANNDKYNDFLNYKPRTQMGRSANENFLETVGEGVTAAVDYYNENEENIPDAVKNTVGAVADTWNDLDESTRFALGNLATVGEVLPMGKAASLIKKGINEAAGTRRINLAASKVPDESAYIDVQERLAANGSRQEMVIARDVEEMPSVESAIETPAYVVPTPKKTVKAYKLFRVDPEQEGKLFTLYVDSETPVAMNKWVESKDVYFFTAKNGKKYVPAKTGVSVEIPDEGTLKELVEAGFSGTYRGKPRTKITCVAYRPGFHAGESPSSSHIGSKEPGVFNDNGALFVNTRRPNEVWAEVEMPDDVDWQSRANAVAKINKDGSMDKRTAHITDQIPFGGFYNYKTNSTMTGDWRISGSIKVNRVLTDDEVLELNLKAGHEDVVRREPRVDEGVVYDNAPAPTKTDTEMDSILK